MLQLIILAVLAAFVLFQLYSVLGRRVGRRPGEGLAPSPVKRVQSGPIPLTDQRLEAEPSFSGLAAIRARDGKFDLPTFLSGAQSAYQTTVKAFAEGDRTALDSLVSPRVMAAFETGIAEREASGRTESVEFLQPPRADIDKAEVEGDSARIMVRFLGEFRSRSKGPEGETVDDRRTAEVWTFERDLKGSNPNWVLVNVAMAEA